MQLRESMLTTLLDIQSFCSIIFYLCMIHENLAIRTAIYSYTVIIIFDKKRKKIREDRILKYFSVKLAYRHKEGNRLRRINRTLESAEFRPL